jgi:hypothetical protein
LTLLLPEVRRKFGGWKSRYRVAVAIADMISSRTWHNSTFQVPRASRASWLLRPPGPCNFSCVWQYSSPFPTPVKDSLVSQTLSPVLYFFGSQSLLPLGVIPPQLSLHLNRDKPTQLTQYLAQCCQFRRFDPILWHIRPAQSFALEVAASPSPLHYMCLEALSWSCATTAHQPD